MADASIQVPPIVQAAAGGLAGAVGPLPGIIAAGTTAVGNNIIGQTSQKLFSAVVGPIAEVMLTGILAAGGVFIIVWAITRAASKSDTGKTAAQVATTAAIAV